MVLKKANQANLYGVPFYANFLKVFANKIINTPKYQQPFILVPSRRIQRELEELFLLEAKQEAILLPKIIPYSDMHEYAFDWTIYCPIIEFDAPQELNSTELKLLVSNLCQKHSIPVSKIDHIISFIVKYYTFCNDLHKIENLDAVYKLIVDLEALLEQNNKLLIQQIRQRFTDKLIATWQSTDIPIFAILPANSIPYIDKFLIFLGNNPNAHIFLHGMDIEKKNAIFNENHECYYIREFLNSTGIAKDDINFIDAKSAHDNIIKLIECHNYHDESKIIALITREHLEKKGKELAIICDDNILASCIKEALSNWGIIVDNTTQEYLYDTYASNLLFLILDFINDHSIHNLLKILTHPNCKYSQTKNTQEFSKYLRRPKLSEDLPTLLKELEKESELYAFIDQLINIIQPFSNQIKANKELPFDDMLVNHFSVFNQLVIDKNICDETSNTVNLINEVYSELLNIPEANLILTLKEYQVLLKSILTNKGYRKNESFTKSVTIITTVEARLQNFETVIIANCNEKYFPVIAEDISIIGTQQERELGFETITSKVRLANYDFQSLINNSCVYVTRSWYISNQLQSPSRYLDDAVCIYELKYRSWLDALQTADYKPIKRPISYFPTENRPKKISISAIEKLIRDPYAYYAEYILKIYKLNEIAEKIGNKDFGIMIHNVISQINPSKIASWENYLIVFSKHLEQQLIDLPHSYSNFWGKRGFKIAQFLWEYESKLRVINTLNEVKGKWLIAINNHKIEIIFRADRVDMLEHSIRVIDFKTGNVPSKGEIVSGLYPQLAIECLALKNGEIDNLVLNKEAVYGEYIELKGIKKAGKIYSITNEILEYTKEGLIRLLEMFYIEESPYFASFEHDPSMKTEHYKRLSRLDEWYEQEIIKG